MERGNEEKEIGGGWKPNFWRQRVQLHLKVAEPKRGEYKGESLGSILRLLNRTQKEDDDYFRNSGGENGTCSPSEGSKEEKRGGTGRTLYIGPASGGETWGDKIRMGSGSNKGGPHEGKKQKKE